jgi:hypothetical protein
MKKVKYCAVVSEVIGYDCEYIIRAVILLPKYMTNDEFYAIYPEWKPGINGHNCSFQVDIEPSEVCK